MQTLNSQLADPDQHPDVDVVIYDGNCRFCQAQVRRLARLDRGARLAFISLHDPRVAQRYPELTHDELMEQMYVVDSGGRRYGGAAAIRYLSRRLPRLWLLMPLLHIPGSMPLWQWLYRQFARRRYRWNATAATDAASADGVCEDGACRIHTR